MIDNKTKKMVDEQVEQPWAKAWLKNESLEALNRRIHGGERAVGKLYEGARELHETAVDLWPEASPGEDSRVLDFGSGVGWPMQAGMDLFPGCQFTGLDISEPMVIRARERLANLANAADYEGRYQFHLYDGTTFPFEDDTFDFIYSYRVLWHIPEYHLFPILMEMARVLKPGGSVVVHFLPFQGLSLERMLAQCEIQKGHQDGHFVFYYNYQKIHWWICKLLGCTDLEIRYFDTRVWVHFSKGGANAIRNETFGKLLVWLERNVVDLPSELTGIQVQIPALRHELERRGERIADLQEKMAGRGEQIAKMAAAAAARDEQISALERTVAERDERVAVLEATLAKRSARAMAKGYADERVATLQAKVDLRDEEVAELQRTITDRDR